MVDYHTKFITLTSWITAWAQAVDKTLGPKDNLTVEQKAENYDVLAAGVDMLLRDVRAIIKSTVDELEKEENNA